MRKGLDGLAMLVQGTLQWDPFSGHLVRLERPGCFSLGAADRQGVGGLLAHVLVSKYRDHLTWPAGWSR
jgi:transposase